MEKIKNIGILAKMLVFQKAMQSIVIRKSAINKHLNYKYATLTDVQDAISTPLATAGLGITQSIRKVDMTYELITTLFDENGEKMESFMPLNMAVKPQELGSILTYYKRYAIVAILNIKVDEDDDASSAPTQGQDVKALFVQQCNDFSAKISNEDEIKKAIEWIQSLSQEQLALAKKSNLINKIKKFLPHYEI